jgi:hypothetical protein
MGLLSHYELDAYRISCAPDSLPPDRQARQMMVDPLKADGFDVSTWNELSNNPQK